MRVTDNYWLTPAHIYERLRAEFGFDFDPCPYPRPEGFNGLAIPWGRSNFVNPPFRQRDTFGAKGPTAFVRKAIEEQARGNLSVLLLPCHSYINLLLEAGAELRSAGRIPWLGTESGSPASGSSAGPSSIVCAVLRPIHDQAVAWRPGQREGAS